MNARVNPASSPPAWVVLPFFLVAPAGILVAGALVAVSGSDLAVALNRPENIAAVHAIVLGWASTTIMGALYQLGAAVFGSAPPHPFLVRLQLGLHVLGVTTFLIAIHEWARTWMVAGAGCLVASFGLFVATQGMAIVRGSGRGLARDYGIVAMGFLVLVAAVGVAFTTGLRWGWWGITDGRLAAHAHLGAIGWVGLLVMGVSYQLVPMFNVVSGTHPRFGRLALGLTAGSLLVFAAAMWTDPPVGMRLGLATCVAAGPALWSVDQLRLIRARSRRKLDIQGLGTLTSVVMLWLTMATGVGLVATGAGRGGDEPLRWIIVYGVFGLFGFPGAALIGNSYKIVPFLVWYHRYRPLVGRQRVPTLADIYSERLARTVLSLFVVATFALVAGVIVGEGGMVTAGGLLIMTTGALHGVGLLQTLLPKASTRLMSASEVTR